MNSSLTIVDGYYFCNLRSFHITTQKKRSKEKQATNIEETHLFKLIDALAENTNSVLQRLQIIEWIEPGQKLEEEFSEVFELLIDHLTKLNAQFTVEVWGVSKAELRRTLPESVNIGLGFIWGNGVSLQWHHSSKAMLEPTTPKICLAGTSCGKSISNDKNEINRALEVAECDFRDLYAPQIKSQQDSGWD